MARFTLLTVALSIQSASAFAPAASSNHQVTALNLVPEQSRQLVAFSQDYLSKKAKESASRASTLTSSRRRLASNDGKNSRGVVGAARGLVTRLLGEEKSARRDTSLSATVDEEMMSPTHQRSEDEILYPIVGFNLVDGHAMPTPGQQAACNLNLPNQGKQEEAVGYWSTSSHGGDSLWM